MKTRIFLILVLIALIPAVSNAQLGGLLKKGASKVLGTVGKEANKEASRQADSAAKAKAQKLIDEKAAQNNQNNQNNQPETQGNQNQNQGNQGGGKGLNLGGLLGGKVDLKHNEDFNYTSKMYMQMELYDKEKKEPTKMDYNLYYSTNSPNAGMEMKTVATTEGESVPFTTQIIVDGENKCFLMLTDVGGMKMGIISAFPDSAVQVKGKDGKPIKEPVVTKTGNSKVIIGFKCDEYIYKEADAKEYTKLWMTKEANLNIDKRVWANSNMASAYNYPGFKGMINMGSEMYDKDGKLTAKSEVKEIVKNFPYSMSCKGYSLRQMDFSKMQQNQKK
jgi:hypothetical protein